MFHKHKWEIVEIISTKQISEQRAVIKYRVKCSCGETKIIDRVEYYP